MFTFNNIKTIGFSFLLMLAFGIQSYAQEGKTASSEELQKWIAKDKNSTRAQKDERVMIAMLFVKDESKAAFEDWVKNVFYDALYKSKNEVNQAQLKATRWLETMNQNEDSSWTYAWIMDPLIPNISYNMAEFLNQAYGEKAGKQHLEAFGSYLARPSMNIFLRQTDF